jgi:hypothetical protein
MKKNLKKEQLILAQISNNPKYKGKQVIIVGDEVHILSTKSTSARSHLLTSLTKKYPSQNPLIIFEPKNSMLTL